LELYILKVEFTWKDLLVSIVYSVGTVALFGMLAFFPLLNVLLILCPVPYIYLTVKRGWVTGAISFVLSACLTGVLLFPLFILLFIVLFGPCVAVVSYILLRRRAVFESVLISAGVLLFSLGAFLGIIYLYVRKDLFALTAEGVGRLLSGSMASFDSMMKLYREAGILNQTMTVEEIVEGIDKTLRMIFPSVMILMALVGGFMIYALSLVLLRRRHPDFPSFPPFANWAMPKGMGMGFLGMIGVAYLGYLLGAPNFQLVLLTIINLLSFIFLVQGLALEEFLLKRKKVHKLLRILLLTISFVFFQYMLTIAGVFEQFFHVRSIIRFKDTGIR
jgi:uncharacterized protein YybS (DUF2232 family)